MGSFKITSAIFKMLGIFLSVVIAQFLDICRIKLGNLYQVMYINIIHVWHEKKSTLYGSV